MAHFDDRYRYASERSHGNRLRRDEYIYTDGNDLISSSGTSVASSEYPAVSPRYHPYTFYYDQPKSNSRIYNYYDRYRPRDVTRVTHLWYVWTAPIRRRRRSRKRPGAANARCCACLVILLLVLLTAAGLGIGLGLAFAGDDGSMFHYINFQVFRIRDGCVQLLYRDFPDCPHLPVYKFHMFRIVSKLLMC